MSCSPLLKPLALVLSVSAGTFLAVSGYVESRQDTLFPVTYEASTAVGATRVAPELEPPLPAPAPCEGRIRRCSPEGLSWDAGCERRKAERGT